VGNLTMPAVLDAVLSASDFERKNAAFEQTRLARERLAEAPEFFRGAGLSATWFGNGFSSGRGELTPASVSMTLNTSGELLIDMPLHGTGGELHRYWSDRAASILGLSADAVNFSLDRPRRNPDQGPSILGRSVTVSTRLVELAGNELAKRRFRDPLPITVTRNRRRSGKAAWDAQAMEGAPFETVSWGAAVVEVEVSNRTGRITSIRCWLSIDGGALLFPEYAASAAETSVQNAVEWCLGDAGPAETFIDIRFYKPSGKRPPRDVSTLPWLTIPAALLRAVRQATGLSVDRLPVGPLVSASGGETR